VQNNTTKTKQKMTIKLTHGWLPTRGHPAYTSPDQMTEICPRCNAAKETNTHFLKCQVEREKWANEYHTNESKPNDPRIQKVLCQAIKDVLNDKIVTVPIEYADIAREQDQIGWQQLIMGRLSKKWAAAYENETGNNTGHRWLSRIIRTTWNHIDKRWKERCELASNENPTTAALNNKEMDEKIKQLYEMRNEVDEVYGKILGNPIEQKQSLPWIQKLEWYSTAVAVIKKGAAKSRQRIREGTHLITRFFRPIQQERILPNIRESIRPQCTTNEEEQTGIRGVPDKHRGENFNPP
jgi:hypothetical protein